MEISFSKILNTKEEIENFDRTKPENVASLLVHVLCNYSKESNNNFFDMLQYLYGDFQPISNLMKQNIKDKMMQNSKYKYIGKSYFKGSIPANDYNVSDFIVEVFENEYSKIEEGYVKLFLKSGGADSLRPITLRLAKDGNYYLWSDSWVGLLSDIRPIESANPWA